MVFPSNVQLSDIQIFGITVGLFFSGSGFILNAFATFRNIKSRKLLNYQELTKSHREIWKITLEKPEIYERVLDPNADVSSKPITYAEHRFIHLLLLHMTIGFYFAKQSDIIEIKKTKFDIDEFLSLPIPREVWLESKKYFNKDFVRFVDHRPRKSILITLRKSLLGTLKRKILGIQPSKSWKILVLSEFPERLVQTLSKLGDELIFMSDHQYPISRQIIEDRKIDFIVCFEYRKLIPRSVLSCTSGINIHGGMLPLNRGPNPNLWSWIDDTKKGVSIHFLSEDGYAGDIIAQREIKSDLPTSIQSSFNRIIDECEILFKDTWPLIRAGQNNRIPQRGKATSHCLVDQELFSDLLNEKGLNMPINEFVSIARQRIEETSIGSEPR